MFKPINYIYMIYRSSISPSYCKDLHLTQVKALAKSLSLHSDTARDDRDAPGMVI